MFRIGYDPERVTPALMLAAVSTKGFRAEVVKDRASASVQEPRGRRDLGQLPTDLQQAVEEAKRRNKPLLFALHGPGCPPCKRMDAETYPDSGVKEELRRWVLVRVDIALHKEVAEFFDVAGIPVVVAITAAGDELGRIENFVEPAAFRARLQELWPK